MWSTNGYGAGASGLPLQPPGPNTQFPLNGGGGPVMLPGGGHNFGPAGGGQVGDQSGGMGGGGGFGHDGRLAGLLGQMQAFRDARHDWRDGGREGDRPRLSAFLQQYRQQQGFAPGPFRHPGPPSY